MKSKPTRQLPWKAPEAYAPFYHDFIRNIITFSCAFGFVKLINFIYFCKNVVNAEVIFSNTDDPLGFLLQLYNI